jgi:diadenylate cyclase
MLVSIFNPKSPLHDGAVVVTGEEIRWARVILPHTSVTQINGLLLGTRHRAGLGISEIADVFVIIVSEENSSISYAREGKLHYNLSVDALRLALIEALGSADGHRERHSLRTLLRGTSHGRRRRAQTSATSMSEQSTRG